MVRPSLAAKVRMGLSEIPYVDESLLDQVAARPEHRQAARRAAQRSMVLLKNEGGQLPFSKDQPSIAVIGPLADSMVATEGPWMVFGHKPAAAGRWVQEAAAFDTWVGADSLATHHAELEVVT